MLRLIESVRVRVKYDLSTISRVLRVRLLSLVENGLILDEALKISSGLWTPCSYRCG
jgi:hypothetical protein